MTEAQGVEVLAVLVSMRAILEVIGVSVVLGVAMLAGILLHRWARGH